MKGELEQRRRRTALNFEIVTVSLPFVRHPQHLDTQEKLDLIAVSGCVVVFNPFSNTVILFTVSIELNAYLPSDHGVADLSVSTCCFF